MASSQAVVAKSAWTERSIAAWLARYTFAKRHLVVVPNCSWPGNECDLLVVTANLRIIDVEIKTTRSDLRADAVKDKWFHSWDYRIDGPYGGAASLRRPRQWPMRVWKHYYCLPVDVWRVDLLPTVASISGVLLIHEPRGNRPAHIDCVRAAKPCRDAQRITPEDAIDIARLASLRMWDALDRLP